MDDQNENVSLSPHEEVLIEAQERFKRCEAFEATARARYLSDYMFAEGDSENGWQWDERDRTDREQSRRPWLTVNKTRMHNLNIINDSREHKASIKFMATGNDATSDSARMWTALARQIEYSSRASDAYDHACSNMVKAGWGYVRVITEYVDERSFQQRLRIVRVADPLKIYIDPDAQERDKSDMRFAFIFEDYNKKDFKQLFPKYADLGDMPAVGNMAWADVEDVRTVEYFRIVDKHVTLYKNEKMGITAFDYELPKDVLDELKADETTRQRPSVEKVVEWKFIVGNKVVEENEWPGKYIPIVPAIAEELQIKGILDRKSHTRYLKDPNRIYNYWTSTAVEVGALQTKTPWLAAADSIDGYEREWREANITNRAVLPFRAYDDAGQALPPPTRIAPPAPAPVTLEGMKVAAEEMAMVSGQYEAQMGAPSNERSGNAINQRQRMGDRSTYHYVDAMAVCIRQVGRIILDTVPRLYEAPYVLELVDEDGESISLKLDPQAQQTYQEVQDSNKQVAQRILNPTLGKYDVFADVGPGYATKREETFQALTTLITQAPQLTGVVGDLLLKAADFTFADEAARRLKRMVPPQALGQGPSQQEQQLQQQVEQLKALLTQTMDEFARAKLQLQGRDEKRDIEIYKAYTQRLQALGSVKAMPLDTYMGAVQQWMNDVSNDSLNLTQQLVDQHLKAKLDVTQANAPMGMSVPAKMVDAGGGMTPPEMRSPPAVVQRAMSMQGEEAPVPGAKRAPDGHWYVQDPLRGGFARVVPTGGQ